MAPERTIKSFSCHDVRVSAMKHSKSFSVSWGNTSSSKRFWNYCQIICVQKLSYAFSVGLHHWKKCGNVIQIFDKCTYLLVFVYFLSWCVENVSERSVMVCWKCFRKIRILHMWFYVGGGGGGGGGGGIKRPLHFVSYLNIEMAPERTIKSFSCHDVRVSAMKHSKSFSVSWGNTSSSKRFWNYCQIICVQKLSYAFSVGLHHWKKCGNVIQIFDKCTYLLVFVYFLSWCVENVSERSAIFTFYKYDINPR